MDNKYDIFIGYSHRDWEIVHHIHNALCQKGITSFIDFTSLSPGANFAETISNAIEQSKIFLQFYSASAAQSNWVLNEIRYCINKGLPIILVLLDDTCIPSELNNIKYIQVDAKDISKSIPQIEQTIKSLLLKDTAYSTTPPSPIAQPHKTDFKQKPVNKQTKNKNWKTIFYIISIAIYTICLSLTYSCGNYLDTTLLSLPLLIGIATIAFYYYNEINYSLKLFCNADGESDIEIKVDGEAIGIIKPENVIKITRKKGKYLITASPVAKELKSISFQHYFTKNNDGEIKEITLPQKKESCNNIVRYKCFIGGSTNLATERNAARAVLNQLYNKWEDENLIVSAYTFEDFSNAQHQQDRYFDFISNEAKCTIFIIADSVGPKTIAEYRVAYKTYTNLKTRPMIFVYANESSKNPEALKFKEEVLRNNSYWRNFNDIESLMSKIKEDIDAELFAIFKMGLQK